MVARARDEMDPAMKTALDGQYAGFNAPDAALDPVQIVRRYADVRDREIVAFIAAGLAFGRVASIMASIEAVTAVMAPSPAAFVRGFDRRRVVRWRRAARDRNGSEHRVIRPNRSATLFQFNANRRVDFCCLIIER